MIMMIIILLITIMITTTTTKNNNSNNNIIDGNSINNEILPMKSITLLIRTWKIKVKKRI